MNLVLPCCLSVLLLPISCHLTGKNSSENSTKTRPVEEFVTGTLYSGVRCKFIELESGATIDPAKVPSSNPASNYGGKLKVRYRLDPSLKGSCQGDPPAAEILAWEKIPDVTLLPEPSPSESPTPTP